MIRITELKLTPDKAINSEMEINNLKIIWLCSMKVLMRFIKQLIDKK